MLDSGGHLKVAGFGLRKLSKVSPDKMKLPQLAANNDLQSKLPLIYCLCPRMLFIRLSLSSFTSVGLYVAPEVYKDEIFDRSVDAFSFGLILYEVGFLFFN